MVCTYPWQSVNLRKLANRFIIKYRPTEMQMMQCAFLHKKMLCQQTSFFKTFMKFFEGGNDNIESLDILGQIVIRTIHY